MIEGATRQPTSGVGVGGGGGSHLIFEEVCSIKIGFCSPCLGRAFSFLGRLNTMEVGTPPRPNDRVYVHIPL